MWLPLMCPLLGDLARNPGMCPDWKRTGDPMVHRPMLIPLSYTSQDHINFWAKILEAVKTYQLHSIYRVAFFKVTQSVSWTFSSNFFSQHSRKIKNMHALPQKVLKCFPLMSCIHAINTAFSNSIPQ